MTLRLYLEVRVDEAPYARDPARWTATAERLEHVAALAEAAGARLSVRAGPGFARLDRHHVLMGLEHRGHEVGWLALEGPIRPAMEALAGAGFADAPRVGSPGPGEGPRHHRRLVHAQDLGLRVMTGEAPRKPSAYAGWLVWEPRPGLVSLDHSVAAADWGAGSGRPDWERLAARIEARAAQVPPPEALAFFGAGLPLSDFADPASEAAFVRFVDRYGPRLGPAAAAAWPLASPPAALPARPLARRLLQRALHRLPVPGRAETVQGVTLRTVGEARHGTVVVVHGGRDPRSVAGLGGLGLRDDALARHGVATVYVEGGDALPGSEAHVAAVRAALGRAGDGPVVLVTWSAGLLSGLRAVDGRVRALVDCEGPVDRWSLVPVGRPDHALAGLDLFDDAAWEGLEALALLGAVPHRYHRIQAQVDHVHGVMHHHAHRAVDHARRAGVPWVRLNEDGDLLPGWLWEHGDQVRRWILDHLRAAP